MKRRVSTVGQTGFTLIEVLVALAIIAIALSAAVRASALMTQGNGMLRDRSLALISAQNQLSELRLQANLANGVRNVECDQGRLHLRCEQTISPLGAAHLLHISIDVSDRSREGPALAHLDSLRFQDNGAQP